MGAVGSMYICVKVECSIKIKATFPNHCACEVVSVSTIKNPSDRV